FLAARSDVLVSHCLGRSVRARDGAPAAPREGFTAVRQRQCDTSTSERAAPLRSTVLNPARRSHGFPAGVKPVAGDYVSGSSAESTVAARRPRARRTTMPVPGVTPALSVTT